jgi:hypothetical protein
MLRVTITVLALAFTASFGESQPAPQSRNQAGTVIEDLLKFPAPTPQSMMEGRSDGVKFSWNSPPPDDAPLDVLGLYWGQIDDSIKAKASAQTRSRLLEACIQKPELTASLLKILPQTPQAQDAIKQIYDANAARLSEGWRDEVKKYLKLNTRYFREELVADALAAADDAEGGYVEKEDELKTLARLDWPEAEPILKRFAADPMPRRSVLAKTLLYRHGPQDANGAEIFSDLKSVVENRKALGYCRDRAAEALLSSEWHGRDEWFLKLFSDPTLRNLHDGMYLRHPLVDLVGENPDHWIPIVTKMIGSPDRAIHDNAVECLIQFQLRNARKDALTPLLPWLSDPKWSSASDRLRLIQSVDELDMRESIPGLIAVLNQKVDEAERAYAANSLVHFRDPRAISDLRRGMPSIVDAHYRRMFISALIAAGGLSDQEAATDIEAFAAMASTEEGAKVLEKADYSWPKVPLPVPVSIGQYFAEREAPTEGTMTQLLSRANVIESSNSLLANLLRDIVHRWPTAAGDHDIATRIEQGTASARSIAYALRRHETFAKNCSDQIAGSAISSGVPAGVFAVLSGDKKRKIEVLQGSDARAVAALLASARLVRESLPLDQVALHYNSGDAQLEHIAGAYLNAEDSPRAREIFSSRSKGLVIVGARQGGGDPGHHSYTDFDKREAELISLMSGDGAYDEVYALLTAGYWGNGGQTVVARQGDLFTITFYDDAARRYRRQLKREEFEQLRSFVQSEKVDDLGPLSQMVFDGMQYEYVHLMKTQGRRVFMNNPGDSDSGGSVYDRLCGVFYKLLGAERLAIEYPGLKQLPGFEVLVADERFHVLGFWKDGATERFRIYPGRDRGSAAMAFSNLGSMRTTSRVPKAENPIWVSIADGIMADAPAPTLFPREDPNSVVPAKFEKENEQRQRSSVAMLSRGAVAYRVGDLDDKSGFWRFEPGKPPKLLVSGDVLSPAISTDGNWALLAFSDKSKRSWAEPNSLIRANLSSGKVLRVDVPEADTLDPVVYVPEQGRFLAYRAKDPPTDSHEPVGPEKPEYWLVNPETGKAEVTSGEVRPLTHVGARPLQRTNTDGQYWAAIPAEKDGGTDIGLYDAKSLKFARQMHVPELSFNSQALWVDEHTRTAYVVYRSQLLKFSLAQPASVERTEP